ncbi:MAG: hypothetical protein LUH15_19920 [Tannerellaceae bacterium]|nr:hypothetical protein [Tannerellaceae bacterium]
MIDLYGLTLLYIVVRQISIKRFNILFLALVISAVIQVLYGSLQLASYLPSNHILFKITGGFFNPGPYAGYLATIFPVILGIVLYKKKYLSFFRKRQMML